MKPLVAVLLLAAVHTFAAEAAPGGGGWVVLPVDDYGALRRKAYPPEPAPDRPAVAATLTRLDYDLRAAGDTAAGTARLAIDVIADGWVQVPIPAALRVGSAHVDGRAVAIVNGAKDRPPHVLLSKRGRCVLSLDIVLPVTASAGTRSLSLPEGGAAVTRAAITVPEAGFDMSVVSGVLSEQRATEGDTRCVAYADSRAPLVFSWRRRVPERRPTLPVRLRGTVIEHVGLGEEAAHLTASVRVEVVQGTAAKIALLVPDGVIVNRVAGEHVADWEMVGGRLDVAFVEPTESAESLVVSAEAPVPREGRLNVPLLRLADTEREIGGVALEVLGAGEVTAYDGRGMDTADVSDLGEPIAGQSGGLLTAFRFRALEGRAARSLSVTLTRYTPQAVLLATIEEARYETLLTSDGKVLVRARYAVRNNTQSFLVARLPAAATLWSASTGGRPVRPGRSAEGAFLLPLSKAKSGEDAPAFVVEVVYLTLAPPWAAEGGAQLALPELDLPVARTALLLHGAPRYRLTLEAGAFREQAYRAPHSPALAAAETSALRYGTPLPAAGAKKNVPNAVSGFADRANRVSGARRSAGVLPIQVPFPPVSGGLFLMSELTNAREAPRIELRYKSMKGGRS
jgi:hypothetical protein